MVDERSDAESESEEPQHKKSLRRSWKSSGPVAKLTVVFAGIAAAASVTYAFTSIWQLSVMSDQLSQVKLAGDQTERAVVLNMGQLAVANRTARSGEQANRLAEESLTSVQRAFVTFPSSPEMRAFTGQKGRFYTLEIPIENAGNTPAHKLRDHVRVVPMIRLPESYTFPDEKGAHIATGANILPAKSRIVSQEVVIDEETILKSYPQTAFSPDALKSPRDRPRGIYFYGWAVYRDIFENTPEHLTEFCRYLTVFVVHPTQLTYDWGFCESHNCTDEDCPDYKEKIASLAK